MEVDEILELQREDMARQQEHEQRRLMVLRDRGFQPDSVFDDANT